MTNNCHKFEEICSSYGLYCIYRPDRRGRMTGVLVIREKPWTLGINFSPKVLFSIKAKSLKEPDWTKLEALVAEKAIKEVFSEGALGVDYQLARNLIVFQEVCYRYGCIACVVSSRKNLFNALSVKLVTPLDPSAREGFYTSSTLFNIKKKSLKNPNWEKLEELVVSYVVLNPFTS